MKFKGTILNMDGKPDLAGEVFPKGCVVKVREVLPVFLDFKNTPKSHVGDGKIVRKGNSLKYEIDIKTEKLPKEVLKYMTPAIGGKVVKRHKNEILECVINQIGISVSGNADPRIKKLGAK